MHALMTISRLGRRVGSMLLQPAPCDHRYRSSSFGGADLFRLAVEHCLQCSSLDRRFSINILDLDEFTNGTIAACMQAWISPNPDGRERCCNAAVVQAEDRILGLLASATQHHS